MASPTAYQAVTSFTAEVKGEVFLIHAGEVLPAGHPVVKANPELFEPPVGQATAEKRKR